MKTSELAQTHIPPYCAPKKFTWCHVQGHNFAIHGNITPKFQKICLQYLWHLVSFLAEETVAEQKNSKISIPAILRVKG